MLCLAAGLSGALRGFADRIGQCPLSFAGSMQVDERSAGAAVSHAVHQLAKVRACVRGKGVPGMPQVVEMDAGQSRLGDGGEPGSAVEVAVPHGRTGQAVVQHEARRPGRGARARGGGAAARHTRRFVRKGTVRFPALDFGGPKAAPPPLLFNELQVYPDGGGVEVDVTGRSAASSAHAGW